MNDNEIVEAIKEMMDVWNRLMAESRTFLSATSPPLGILRDTPLLMIVPS